MKFTKSQNLILATLGLIGVTFIIIPIINHSDKYIMPTIALISGFVFGMYRNYLKNKRFVGKDTKIFLLYNRKTVNIFNIVLSLFLVGIIIFISIYIYSFLVLLVTIGTFFYIFLSWLLFPYGNGTLIMVNNSAIYSYETGFVEWEQIKKYTIKTDLMLLDIELKNNEKKSIEYNKFVDVELFTKELKMKFEI